MKEDVDELPLTSIQGQASTRRKDRLPKMACLIPASHPYAFISHISLKAFYCRSHTATAQERRLSNLLTAQTACKFALALGQKMRMRINVLTIQLLPVAPEQGGRLRL